MTVSTALWWIRGAILLQPLDLSQYLAYCRHVGQSARIDAKRRTDCRFGIGSARSKGMATSSFPFNAFLLSYDTHIVDGDIPLLLSIAAMDKLKLHFNYIIYELYHELFPALAFLITQQFGHLFYLWQPMLRALFTEAELRRLHRLFGHPHNEKLYNLLRRARLASVTEDTRRMLDDIVKHCEACQVYSAKRGGSNLRCVTTKTLTKVLTSMPSSLTKRLSCT